MNYTPQRTTICHITVTMNGIPDTILSLMELMDMIMLLDTITILITTQLNITTHIQITTLIINMQMVLKLILEMVTTLHIQ